MSSRKTKKLDLQQLVKAKNIWHEATRGMTAAEKRDFAKWLDKLDASKRKKSDY